MLVFSSIPFANSESNSRVYSEIFSSLYDTHRIVSKPPFLDSVVKILDGKVDYDLESQSGKLTAAKAILGELYKRYDVDNQDYVDQLSEEAKNSGVSLAAFNEHREFLLGVFEDELRASIFVDILILMIPHLKKTLASHSWSRFLKSSYMSRIESGIYEFRSAHQSAIQMRVAGLSEEANLDYFAEESVEQPESVSFDELMSKIESSFFTIESGNNQNSLMAYVSQLSQVSSSDSLKVFALVDSNYLNEISDQVKAAKNDFRVSMNTMIEVRAGLERLTEVQTIMRSGSAYLDQVVNRFPEAKLEYQARVKRFDELISSIESRLSSNESTAMHQSILGHLRLIQSVYSSQIQTLEEREKIATGIRAKARLVLTAVDLRIAEINILSAGGRIDEIQPVIRRNSELDRSLNQFLGIVEEKIEADEKSPIEVRNEQLVKAFVENDLSFGIAPVFALMEIIERGHRQPELYNYLRNKIMEPFAGNVTLYIKAFLALYPDKLEDVYLAIEEKIAPKDYHASVDKSVFQRKQKIFIDVVKILYAEAIQNPEYFVLLREARLKFEESYRSSKYPRGKDGKRHYLEDLLFYTALDNPHHKKRLSCEAFIALGKTFYRRVQ